MMRSQAPSLLRKSLVRSSAVPLAAAGRRAQTTHAISKPTLANIEKRWEGMPLQEQADLWMALRDRMKGNWKELTIQEQKAGACFCPFFYLTTPTAETPESCREKPTANTREHACFNCTLFPND